MVYCSRWKYARILLLVKDGTLLAEVDCYDMFGTRYPWIEDMKVKSMPVEGGYGFYVKEDE